MSAYVVSHKHINTILTGANQARLEKIYIKKDNVNGHDLDLVPSQNFDGNYLKFDLSQTNDLQTLASFLLSENCRSVNHRYNEKSPAKSITFKFEPVNNAIQLIKLIDCLDYQSCETDTWENSLSFKVLTKIKGQLVDKMLRSAGYDDHQWSI